MKKALVICVYLQQTVRRFFTPSITWFMVGLALCLTGLMILIETAFDPGTALCYVFIIAGAFSFFYGFIKLYGESQRERLRNEHLEKLFKR